MRRMRLEEEHECWLGNGLVGGSGVPRGESLGGFNLPPPQIPKVLQNRAKINPIVKTVKNCWI